MGGDTERMYAKETHLQLKRFPIPAGLKPGSLGQQASDLPTEL